MWPHAYSERIEATPLSMSRYVKEAMSRALRNGFGRGRTKSRRVCCHYPERVLSGSHSEQSLVCVDDRSGI